MSTQPLLTLSQAPARIMRLMSPSRPLGRPLDGVLNVVPTEHTIVLQTVTELGYGFYARAPHLVQPRVDCSLAAGQ